uniref:Uncharacterized protein n=1 Tax=viral metagenome TaxID=1070528 RepID=A0A6C0EH49_9ZZZZ
MSRRSAVRVRIFASPPWGVCIWCNYFVISICLIVCCM